MPEETIKRSQFLFVDDEPEFLAALTSQLKEFSKAHWAFRTATNHSQALEQLKAQPVEIIVLDVEMPVMDGVEFLRLLRHTHPAQRVVMLSGRLDETVRKSAIELGQVCSWRNLPRRKASAGCSPRWRRWWRLDRNRVSAESCKSDSRMCCKWSV